jgi:dipeptidyl aminopeptidase/acylaminoacyl peptidase
MSYRKLFVSLLLILGFLSLNAKELPSVETYFKNPEFRNFALSPDGKTIAVLANLEGFMNIVVMDLDNPKPTFITKEERDISSFWWVNDERILFEMNSFLFDQSSQKTAGGIFAVNKDGSKYRVLQYPIGHRGRKTSGEIQQNLPISLRYLANDPSDDDYVFVTHNKRRLRHPDICRMNVYNGRFRTIELNPDRISSYSLDGKGRIRMGVEITDEFKLKYYIRDLETEEWKFVDKFDEEYESWSVVGFNKKDDSFLVASNHATDTYALYNYDPKTGEFSSKPIYHDPDYDITGQLSVSRVKGEDTIRAIYYERDKLTAVPFDKRYAELHAMLAQAIPGGVNQIVSFNDDETIAVVRNISDINPPTYYLFRIDELKLEPLANTYPWLNSDLLVPTKPISYKARDGLDINGYLTLPRNYENGKPVPLIIHPHGGPWARDSWGIRSWIDLQNQFLASRGFAVLQVNFRGSTGYGKDHLTAHIGNLDKMHYDLMDGLQWCIDQGYADENMIGIMGASWGGYATMTALVKEPDTFKFGVNIFGVVDIPEQIFTYRDDWDRDTAYHVWVNRAGDPSIEEERAHLEEWSAINFIENIKAPVFVYHGLKDFNVDIKQSRMLVDELEDHNIEHEVIFKVDEAHSAFDETNRFELYKSIDEFLKPFSPLQ